MSEKNWDWVTKGYNGPATPQPNFTTQLPTGPIGQAIDPSQFIQNGYNGPAPSIPQAVLNPTPPPPPKSDGK